MPLSPSVDEAEGSILEHTLSSPSRSSPPLPPDQLAASSSSYIPISTEGRTQPDRLAGAHRKMDWEDEVAAHSDEHLDLTSQSKKQYSGEMGGPVEDGGGDANSERCVICLMALRDRTIVGVCGHEFCFECIGVWANQSRRCPLCSADMAPFMLHDLDNPTPTKFYLPPLPSRTVPSLSMAGPSSRNRRVSDPHWERTEKEERDELGEQVERRREIYQHGLYCKHIASNPITRFRPSPTPRQIAVDPNMIQRATAFMRRELRVWSAVDVEFLTTYILSLLKAIDIRSEPAVRLLAEFLDSPNGSGYPHGAEHFAHELYSYLRSPYKELIMWDAVAQYDPIPMAMGRSASPRSPISKRHISVDRLPSGSPQVRPEFSSRSPSRGLSPLSSRSRSPPFSPSRSRSPRRDWSHRDTFVAPPTSRQARRWDEPDTWLDPEYAAWLDDERRREEDRLRRRRARRVTDTELETRREQRVMRTWGKPRIELLPSPPPALLRMDEEMGEEVKAPPLPVPSLHIKGAAKEIEPRRISLLERLAKAKAEAVTLNGTSINGMTADPTQPPALTHSILEPLPRRATVHETVRDRLQLQTKLESERATLKHNINESRAQELRRRLLDAKANRQAAETDVTLRKMDRLERAVELRRRLMVLKIMAAETEGERKQRELKERLMAEKRRRMLREMLLVRKTDVKGLDGGEGGEQLGATVGEAVAVA